MSFDEDKLTAKEEYPCPKCNKGNVSFNRDIGCWECDNCVFTADPPNQLPRRGEER